MTDMVKVRIRHEDQETDVWCHPELASIGRTIEVNILDGLWEIIDLIPEIKCKVE